MILLVSLLSFSLCFVLVPPVIALSWRIGAVDVPSDWRRMHHESIARGGGIAIYLAFALSLLALEGVSLPGASLLAGGLLMLLVGLADDIFCLGAWVKLFFQVTVTVATVLGSGAAEGRGAIFAVFWVVTLTNAHNFVDGLDGLLAGTGAIEGAALWLAHLLSGRGDASAAPLLLALACLAFRYFNRYPAVVFAGDCGSGVVGFLLGMLSLPLLSTSITTPAVLSPLLIFAYPLTDLVTAVVRRLLRGKSPFSADRAHLHHRITAAGLTYVQCGGVLLAISAGLAVVGVLVCAGWLLPSALASLAAALLLIGLRRFILDFS